MTTKLMKFKLTVLTLAVVSSPLARAQLYIDNGGARDLFFAADASLKDKAGNLRFKVDTADKSATATYFAQPGSGKIADGFITMAFTAKAKSPDDFSELWKAKGIDSSEAALVANWTSAPASVTKFVNLRAAYKHDKYSLFDPTKPVASQLTNPSFDGGSVHLALGALVNGNHGWAFSIGFERGSNYEDLKKVTISDVAQTIPLADGGQRAVGGASKSARLGVLERRDEYPATLLGYRELPGAGFDAFIKGIPFMPKGSETETVSYGAQAALYVRSTSFSGSSSRQDIGASITIRRQKGKKTEKKDGAEKPTEVFDHLKAGDSKIDFPFGFYVERRAVSGTGTLETMTGAVVVFKFP